MRDYCLASVVTVLRESYPLDWKPHLAEELVEAKGQAAIEAFNGSIEQTRRKRALEWKLSALISN
jgi:hypothetical protein